MPLTVGEQVTAWVSVGLGDWMCSRGMRLRTTIRGWVSFIRVWCTAYGNNDVHYVSIVANYFNEGFGRALGWRQHMHIGWGKNIKTGGVESLMLVNFNPKKTCFAYASTRSRGSRAV